MHAGLKPRMTREPNNKPGEGPYTMKRVTYDDYLEYIKENDTVQVENTKIKLEPIKVRRLHPTQDELTDTSTTVWSFPKRGRWATHRGDYRGNWPPQLARALILTYTMPGDTILDPMMGSGTTCIEAKLLGRNCIGVDINYNAVILALHRLYWLEKHLEETAILQEGLKGKNQIEGPSPSQNATLEEMLEAKVEIYHGDARNLDKIRDETIDLVATHPPYYNIIRYGKKREKTQGDLSRAKNLQEYLEMLRKIAEEAYRVLRPGRHMAILLGDTRIRKHYIPITHYALQELLKTGFILKEEIIKIQHKMKTTREKWSKLKERDFLLIYHEKLFVLRKPYVLDEHKRYI